MLRELKSIIKWFAPSIISVAGCVLGFLYIASQVTVNPSPLNEIIFFGGILMGIMCGLFIPFIPPFIFGTIAYYAIVSVYEFWYKPKKAEARALVTS